MRREPVSPFGPPMPKTSSPLRSKGDSGIWEGFLSGVRAGAVYKYHIVSRHGGFQFDKADPFSFCSEVPPDTGSVVWDLSYEWGDPGLDGGTEQADAAGSADCHLLGSPGVINTGS